MGFVSRGIASGGGRGGAMDVMHGVNRKYDWMVSETVPYDITGGEQECVRAR